MRAKQYLSQYRRCKKKIARLEEQIQALAELCSGIAAPQIDGDRVQSSHNPDRMGEVIAKKSDLEAELMDEVVNAIDIMNEVTDTINEVENVDYQTLLEKRYIGFKTWEVIADEMHFSARWVLTMHGRALWEVEKIINGLAHE